VIKALVGFQRLEVLVAIGGIAAALAGRAPIHAQAATTFDPAIYREMEWRNIGSFEGGRTDAAAGVPSQPNVFYIGVSGGGIWKTTDYGRSWHPIFDDQPTSSIGALAVAGSNPNVIYAGSGDASPRLDATAGDGVYKSIDAGRTWTHLGLRGAQQIARIAVDPTDPNRLFVAVPGHPYGANEERGIFRSTNGGQTFEKVLYTDADTGAADVALDPKDPKIVFATLWQARVAPWQSGTLVGPSSGVFKSVDGGATWKPIVSGLPTFDTNQLGRVALAIAPSRPARLFAVIAAGVGGGLYRSDDAGTNWSPINTDSRLALSQSPDANVSVDPSNPDVVYAMGAMAWRSTDGGKTFAAWRGRPGGEGYHGLWINPENARVMLLAGDHGAAITVNGGDTWSSQVNQPTAPFVDVSTDAAFPYRVCGGQPSGTVACVVSRGESGQIAARDWKVIAVSGPASVATDPVDPEIVYSGGVARLDRRTGQTQDVTPASESPARTLVPAPLLFAPLDPRALFFASDVLWRTINAGQSWTAISPDLSRPTSDPPPTLDRFHDASGVEPVRRGAIAAVGLSAIDQNVVWAGTDDGVVQVTRDGGRAWVDVTPPQLQSWAKVAMIEASHFDVNTAYVAVDERRLDDRHPYIFRTRDAGRTWTLIASGLPADAPANGVREDLQRRGLLFAGTDDGVYVSFDDGDHWDSLRLNMPTTPVRDLTIKDDDLVIATHGRGLWILDDISPLRQITGDVIRADAFLFRPPTAWRFHSGQPSAPAAPDEPAAPNPPDGVVISYWLGSRVEGPITLEIRETTTDTLIRRFSSDATDTVASSPIDFLEYWRRPAARLSAAPGLHRFVWDVRFAPPSVDTLRYATAAVPHDTPKEPRGMWAMPGTYQVRLTVNGRVYRQAVLVRTDPRVRTSAADLRVQFTLSKSLDDAIRALSDARAAVKRRQSNVTGEGVARWQTLAAALDAAYAPLPALFSRVQAADLKPTTTTEAAVQAALDRVQTALALTREEMRQ
jgi:photosystem II stability/assembly factor-like uncharacterized protein